MLVLMVIKMTQCMMHQFAENYAKKGLVRLREIFIPGTLKVPKTPSALKDLESIHKVSFATLIFWSSLEWSSKRVSLGTVLSLSGAGKWSWSCTIP